MRRALPTSLVLHLGLLGGAYMLFTGAAPYEPDGVESMTVDVIPIVATTNVSPTEAEIEQSVPLVSAGADQLVEATEPDEPLEAEVVKVLDPVETTTAEAVEADEPVEVQDPVAVEEPIKRAALPEPVEVAESPEQVEPIELALANPLLMTPTLAEPLEAEVTEGFEIAPVPRPRTSKQMTEPTYPEEQPKTAEPEEEAEPRKAEKKAEKKTAEKSEKKTAEKKKADKKAEPKTQRVANLGNGGESKADAAAGKASGGKGKKADPGNAKVTNYKGLVQRHLNRSVKDPRAGSGNVSVSFVVASSGSVSGVSLAQSSGNSRLDNAALAAVKRAAPFPPIPPEAGRSSWPFTIPLTFRN